MTTSNPYYAVLSLGWKVYGTWSARGWKSARTVKAAEENTVLKHCFLSYVNDNTFCLI
jgi:hypothetical protein